MTAKMRIARRTAGTGHRMAVQAHQDIKSGIFGMAHCGSGLDTKDLDDMNLYGICCIGRCYRCMT